MAQLEFDLSGGRGLVERYQGDLNDTTGTPHRRYLGAEGEFADGIFNPIRKYGYIQPANNVFSALTGNIVGRIIATEYDSINDDAYFADSVATIWRLDGLADTSLTSDIVVNQTGTEALRDLEIYELNGTRSLFYSYNLTDSTGRSSKIGVKGIDADSGIYVLEKLEDTETSLLATITGSTGTRKLVQTLIPTEDGLTFNRVVLPLLRGASDDGGYTIQVSIQDIPQTHSVRINTVPGGSAGPTGGFMTIADASQTGLDILGDITIECWVKFESVSAVNGDTSIFVAKNDRLVSEGYYFGLFNNAGTYQLQFYSNVGGDNFEAVNWTPTMAKWYHVSMTRATASGDVKFYVNGVQQGATQSGPTGNMNNSSAAFVIGTGLANGDDEGGLDGWIDEVRVWNSIRTAAQLKANTHLGLVGNESGLQAYYRFNNSLLDETANNNDLTKNAGDFDSGDFPIMAPDGTADATGTKVSTDVSTAVTGAQEITNYITFDLDTTITKTTPFAIVVETTNYGDMGAADSFSWFGDDDQDDIADCAGLAFDGTDWSYVDSTNFDDFDFALVLTESQTWSFDKASGHLSLDYNADIFMCKADNGFMYFFEDNKVHRIDGTVSGGGTGTISANVLRFPSYFQITDAVDTRGRMYIAVQSNPNSGYSDERTYAEGITGVYVWDRQSTVVGTRDFIPLYGVRDIKKLYVEPNGEVRAICIGDDRFVQIRAISAGGKIIQTLGMQAYPDVRDGLKVINNMTVWLGVDGIFYMHGARRVGEPEGLYKIGTMTSIATGAFTSGAIFVGHDESSQSRQGVVFSFTDTADDKLYRWFPHGVGTISSVAQTGNQGDVYTLVKFLPQMSTVDSIDVYMLPTGTGSTQIATIKPYFNQSSSAWASKAVTLNDASKGEMYIQVGEQNIHAVQFEIEFSTSQTLGNNDFAPIVAVVNYTPTTGINRR